MSDIEIPDGWLVVGVVTIVKALDGEGKVQLITHADEGISTFEAIGMTCHTSDILRKALFE